MYESHYGIENMVLEHGKDLRCVNRRTICMLRVTIICLLLISGCAMTPLLVHPIDNTRLNDGTYLGFYEGGLNSALVEVSILNQKIIDVTVLEHDALLGKKAEKIIIREILESQSTEVDSVSGATNSSHVIINAVQIALDKALQEKI